MNILPVGAFSAHFPIVYENEIYSPFFDAILIRDKGFTIRNFGNSVGRNDLCFCGSGIKNKKCCGK